MFYPCPATESIPPIPLYLAISLYFDDNEDQIISSNQNISMASESINLPKVVVWKAPVSIECPIEMAYHDEPHQSRQEDNLTETIAEMEINPDGEAGKATLSPAVSSSIPDPEGLQPEHCTQKEAVEMSKSQRRYKRRKALGLCACGVKSRKVYCPSCYAKAKRKDEGAPTAYQDNGLCSCGGQRDSEHYLSFQRCYPDSVANVQNVETERWRTSKREKNVMHKASVSVEESCLRSYDRTLDGETVQSVFVSNVPDEIEVMYALVTAS
ncbi:hypothetical protein CIB48_g8388 [Xylaria polymorpha]|nr:hypothetical protein CIB48_g8388 [Xylaria polymorpha]